MNAAAVVAPREGEVVGDSPQRRLEILSEHDDLHATWSRFAARREGADLHVHRRHCDVFYVLEGELTLRLGVDDEQVAAPAGTLALVPPLVVHGFRNASAADVRYLNLHAPGMRFADYLRALRDGRTLAYDQEEPPPDGGRPRARRLFVSRPTMARWARWRSWTWTRSGSRRCASTAAGRRSRSTDRTPFLGPPRVRVGGYESPAK